MSDDVKIDKDTAEWARERNNSRRWLDAYDGKPTPPEKFEEYEIPTVEIEKYDEHLDPNYIDPTRRGMQMVSTVQKSPPRHMAGGKVKKA